MNDHPFISRILWFYILKLASRCNIIVYIILFVSKGGMPRE
nr:MAG TPA: hypothetical protein [Caudoviricetes sp.]